MMALDRAAFYDAELQRHHEHFRAAIDAGPRDRVLDIGCGAGQSARDAARAAAAGSVVGVDVSAEMLEVARRRATDAGLRNIAFELGDAQVHGFPVAHFDLCISRFGMMFFADPIAAFANIGRALRPGARLMQMVWQSRARNEWALAIQDALAPAGVSPAGESPAFSLGDPEVTARILTSTGFVSIDIAEVHEPVFYGPSVDAALEAIVGLFLPADRPIDSTSATDATLRRLRAMLDARVTADGVFFDSRAWIVTARRAGGA